MNPGGVADELFEEGRSDAGAAVARSGGVHEVGDLALDLVAVVARAGQPPELLAGGGKGIEEVLRGGVVVGEEAGVVVSEGCADGSGERGSVDEARGAESLGVEEAVGEDEAAFGVGVDDLDGLAGHSGEHVAGFEGATVGHVLAGADDGEDAHGGLELSDRAHGTDHGGGTGHVVLHLVHVVGGLDGDAAGVKGDALADEAEDGGVRRRRRWRFKAQDDERGRLGRALRDGGECTHLQLKDLVGGVDLTGEAGNSSQLLVDFF